MRNQLSWEDLLALVLNATGETLYMVALASLFTLLIGLPLGVVLFITRKQGILPAPRINGRWALSSIWGAHCRLWCC
ncbi:DL-methionine transporter permease subunit [Serratia plymuthica]|uniref:DL-methionine transporter permease subunit n=1 Tax=Serratia plymuthica TaxID=82996 RepID=A0A2X4UKP1_SERPL|nr:DL-methionine transporter permease subunit [Serratia plymuthica]